MLEWIRPWFDHLIIFIIWILSTLITHSVAIVHTINVLLWLLIILLWSVIARWGPIWWCTLCWDISERLCWHKWCFFYYCSSSNWTWSWVVMHWRHYVLDVCLGHCLLLWAVIDIININSPLYDFVKFQLSVKQHFSHFDQLLILLFIIIIIVNQWRLTIWLVCISNNICSRCRSLLGILLLLIVLLLVIVILMWHPLKALILSLWLSKDLLSTKDWLLWIKLRFIILRNRCFLILKLLLHRHCIIIAFNIWKLKQFIVVWK